MSVQKYSGKISEVEIGKGEKAIKIGGESTLPFYSFDGNTGNNTNTANKKPILILRVKYSVCMNRLEDTKLN